MQLFQKISLSLVHLASLLHVVMLGGFQLVFISFFGSGFETDVYLTTLIIVKSLFLIASIYNDLFIRHYNFTKHNEGKERADLFYYIAILVSIIGGLILAISLSLTKFYIIKIFLLSSEASQLLAAIEPIFWLVIITVSLYPLINLHNNWLIANERLIAFYLFSALIPTVDLVFIFLFQEIRPLFYSLAIGHVLSLLLRFIYASCIKNLSVKKIFQEKILWQRNFTMVKESFLIKNIANIHNFLKEPITLNLLSQFSAGTITLFNYGYGFANIIYKAFANPLIQKNISTISNLIALKRYNEIHSEIKKTSFKTAFLLIGVSLISSVAIWWGLPFIFIKLNLKDISELFSTFITSSFFFLVLAFEQPYNNLIWLWNRAGYFLLANSAFLLAYFTIGWITFSYWKSPELIMISQGFAQIFVFGIYYQFTYRILAQARS